MLTSNTIPLLNYEKTGVMTLKPIIGVTPVIEKHGDQFRVSTANTKAIEQAGGIPIILSLTENRKIIETTAKKLMDST